VPAGYTTGNSSNFAEIPGNYATGQAWDFAPYINDTIQVIPEVKVVGGVRLDNYWAQVGTLNNLGISTAYTQQSVNFVSWRGGVIFQPDKVQSYYFSYSTSFNPSLEQLVSTTGTTSPLPPETNEAFEVGAKYDFFNGGLSLTGALLSRVSARASPAASRRNGRCGAAIRISMPASSMAPPSTPRA
jgi:catecholate siderophore receptor